MGTIDVNADSQLRTRRALQVIANLPLSSITTLGAGLTNTGGTLSSTFGSNSFSAPLGIVSGSATLVPANVQFPLLVSGGTLSVVQAGVGAVATALGGGPITIPANALDGNGRIITGYGYWSASFSGSVSVSFGILLGGTTVVSWSTVLTGALSGPFKIACSFQLVISSGAVSGFGIIFTDYVAQRATQFNDGFPDTASVDPTTALTLQLGVGGTGSGSVTPLYISATIDG